MPLSITARINELSPFVFQFLQPFVCFFLFVPTISAFCWGCCNFIPGLLPSYFRILQFIGLLHQRTTLQFRFDYSLSCLGVFKGILFPIKLCPNQSLSMAFNTPYYLVLTKSPASSTTLPHAPEFLPTSLNISNLQPLDDNYWRASLLHFISLYMGWFYVGETSIRRFLEGF